MLVLWWVNSAVWNPLGRIHLHLAARLHRSSATGGVARARFDAPALGTRIQVGSGFSGECVRTGSLLCCDDAEIDSRVDRESCRALGIRSIIAMPIRIGDAVMGLLEVFSPNANAFGARDNTVLRHLGEAVLLALNRAARVSAEMGSALKASASSVPHPTAALPE